jgi:hypothetical protein
MENRPSDDLKIIAAELARHISAGNISAACEPLLAQLAGNKYDPAYEEAADSGTKAAHNTAIGIWKKTVEDGKSFYSRDAARQIEWALWANINELPAKSSKKRLVLLGESVARGYLYDPHYNVARELEAILNEKSSPWNAEVVDLAKTSISMKELLELADACTALEPDIAVIFAGNNWDPALADTLNEEDVNTILEIFRQDGFPGIKDFLSNRLRDLVTQCLEQLSASLTGKGIPVVFVIPEFNLIDWKSDHIEQGLLWLPEEKMKEWLQAKDLAEQAGADMEKLGAAAARMVALNPSNPLGYELLGHYYATGRQYAAARDCFESSRDTVLFTGGVTKPRCYKVIREQILAEAPRLGIKIIDLPAVFASAFPDKIPDKSLFLDYCHLTVEGIKLAMRHTAAAIIGLATGKPIDAESIHASALYPDRHVQAVAHFGAAIHNAHNGQPQAILQYHCNRSVGFSNRIKDTMLRFIDFSSRHASTFFCKSFEEIISDGEMRQYEGGLLSLVHPRGRKLMDVELVDAIVKALDTVHIQQADIIDRLRIKEHGVGPERVNLLDSFYSASDYNEFLSVPKSAFLQYRTLTAPFHFVAGKDHETLSFSITCRTPEREEKDQYIKIYLNDEGECITALPMCNNWNTHHFMITERLLKAGVNRLVIKWPYTAAPLPEVSRVSRNALLNAMYPVMGEISSFFVKVCNNSVP